jgi:hypothetical protein
MDFSALRADSLRDLLGAAGKFFDKNPIFNSRSSTARLPRLQFVALDVAPRSIQNKSRCLN